MSKYYCPPRGRAGPDCRPGKAVSPAAFSRSRGSNHRRQTRPTSHSPVPYPLFHGVCTHCLRPRRIIGWEGRAWPSRVPFPYTGAIRAAASAHGGSVMTRRSAKPCPMPSSKRSACPDSPSAHSSTRRTAVYGPVRTVVWEGRAGNRSPIPIEHLMGNLSSRRRDQAFQHELLRKVRERLALPATAVEPHLRKVGETEVGGLTVEKLVLETEPAIGFQRVSCIQRALPGAARLVSSTYAIGAASRIIRSSSRRWPGMVRLRTFRRQGKETRGPMPSSARRWRCIRNWGYGTVALIPHKQPAWRREHHSAKYATSGKPFLFNPELG